LSFAFLFFLSYALIFWGFVTSFSISFLLLLFSFLVFSLFNPSLEF
jgi:hypothetical protein